MTDTTHTTSTPGSACVPRRRPRRRGLVAGLATGAGLAIGVTAVAFALADADDGDEPQAPATLQIAAARQACRQWLDDSAPSQGGAGPGAGWCNDMARWMTDNMTTGQMMMGPMMWSSPEGMRDVCVQAMGTGQSADATQWCDQMVAWMS
jgi:hypothetical protein